MARDHQGGKEALNPPVDTAPITPLGVSDGRLHLIDAIGRYRTISEKDAERGSGLTGMMICGVAGDDVPSEEWCTELFPPRRDRDVPDWDRRDVGVWLIKACLEVGVISADLPLRNFGVWREGDSAVAHLGDSLAMPDGSRRKAGAKIGSNVYPRTENRGELPVAGADIDETNDFLGRVKSAFGWRQPADAEAWFGFVAHAALGAFPRWRAHLAVDGRRGSGKTELARLAIRLLSPLVADLPNSYTAAGLRQSANHEARPFVLDEAEGAAHPDRFAEIVELTRMMSGDDGARTLRGSKDHVAASFRLHGAVYLSAILPPELEPQDRSRFVSVSLAPLPPTATLDDLEALQAEAEALGPRLVRRMLTQSQRYDTTLSAWRSFVRARGGDARQAETAGAVLAGFDLAMWDDPPDQERLNAHSDLVDRLLLDAQRLAAESEGEAAWNWLVRATPPAMSETVSEIIMDAAPRSQTKLQRLGLKWVGQEKQELVVVNERTPTLDRIFASTKWRDTYVSAFRQAGFELRDKRVTVNHKKGPVLVVPLDLRPVSDPE